MPLVLSRFINWTKLAQQHRAVMLRKLRVAFEEK
jgi:hypothetical protein